ncbi:hypothetical protein ACF8C4_01555 [Myroides odoratimimus]|uniref:hypothetical protein n=1 Tax=Myroides TaxID=76831 RepID=UPI0025749B78|nr:hypothetical protein [Myroides odoratimimus]MDM1513731.1 hypothetical protein [Myroides odoratimimus]
MKVFFTIISILFTSLMFAQTSAYSTPNTSYDAGGYESIDYIGKAQRELQQRYTRNQNRFNDAVEEMLENVKYSYDREVVSYTFSILKELNNNGKIQVDFTSDYNTSAVIKELRIFIRDISREEQQRLNAEKQKNNYK